MSTNPFTARFYSRKLCCCYCGNDNATRHGWRVVARPPAQPRRPMFRNWVHQIRVEDDIISSMPPLSCCPSQELSPAHHIVSHPPLPHIVATRRKRAPPPSRNNSLLGSFGSEIPLRLAPHLLCLDLGRNNSVMDNVGAVDCVDGGHPIVVLCYFPSSPSPTLHLERIITYQSSRLSGKYSYSMSSVSRGLASGL
jgi:hypothetical protein